MTSVDQLQCNLGLTDAALTHDQNTFTKQVKKYTMNAAARCKLYIEPADHLRHKGIGLFAGAKQWHLILAGKPDQLVINVKITTEYNTRRLCMTLTACHDDLHHFQCVIQTLLLHICVLYMTNDLYPSGIKVIKKACKLQSRTVHVGLHDLDP